jgi:SAM-dependent methyltransferase
MRHVEEFYGNLAPFYHLIYPDWEASIRRQAGHLDQLIRENWSSARLLLDASCGIGTQALGLAALGYQVTASDISSSEVERAREEAGKRDLTVEFQVCDMRGLPGDFGRRFDVVLSCDNSLPHLLSEEEIVQALGEFRRCLRSGGGCLISLRDYAREDLSRMQVKPYGIREVDGARWLLWQVWEPDGSTYRADLYIVEDRGGNQCETHVFRTRYFPITIARVASLMAEAGFRDVKRFDERFFQPVLVGTAP